MTKSGKNRIKILLIISRNKHFQATCKFRKHLQISVLILIQLEIETKKHLNSEIYKKNLSQLHADIILIYLFR